MDINTSALKLKIHKMSSFVERATFIPEVGVKISQLSLVILTGNEGLQPLLAEAKNWTKDVKIFLDFFKGFKAVDGAINQSCNWKTVTLNLSGMTLFTLSIVSLVERFQVMNVSFIKVSLAATPIFGALPYGGLISFSKIGLSSMLFQRSLEKKVKFEKEMEKSKDKVKFWSTLTKDQLYRLKARYRHKACKLKKESGQTHCELIKKYDKKTKKMVNLIKACKKKNLGKIEFFRQNKQSKWKVKVHSGQTKVQCQQLSQIKYTLLFSKNILLLASVVSGYGVALPFIINFGVELIGFGCEMRAFFLNKSIKKIVT